MSRVDSILHDKYYNPKNVASFGGVQKLYNEVRKVNPGVKIDEVKQWLKRQETYTLFKPVRRKFLRLKTIQNEIDKQWQGDLLDLSWLAKSNSGVKYLLVLIDVLSRFAFVRPLKNKTSSSIISAMQSVFREGRMPKKLQTDQGTEFTNKNVQQFLKEKKIIFFTTTDENIKCALAERLNRTLREKIYRFLHKNRTHRYTDVLSDIVNSYNNSVHRMLKMKPADVSVANQKVAFQNLYGKSKLSTKKSLLPVGATVRIPRVKGKFEKGATSNWTEELFKITGIKDSTPRTVYTLADQADEPITSIFYPEEVTEAVSEEKEHLIEKVIKKRKKGSHFEYFVKWIGLPDKFNSWVDSLQAVK